MVRLLPMIEVEFENKKYQFQSHNGAIAAQLMLRFSKTFSPSFNPTMVRLLPGDMISWYAGDMTFQSHNGAIAAILACGTKFALTEFQSHNGAIAAKRAMEVIKKKIPVSIPQWCDCCEGGYELNFYGWKFQSHNGAIAAGKR